MTVIFSRESKVLWLTYSTIAPNALGLLKKLGRSLFRGSKKGKKDDANHGDAPGASNSTAPTATVPAVAAPVAAVGAGIAPAATEPTPTTTAPAPETASAPETAPAAPTTEERAVPAEGAEKKDEGKKPPHVPGLSLQKHEANLIHIDSDPAPPQSSIAPTAEEPTAPVAEATETPKAPIILAAPVEAPSTATEEAPKAAETTPAAPAVEAPAAAASAPAPAPTATV